MASADAERALAHSPVVDRRGAWLVAGLAVEVLLASFALDTATVDAGTGVGRLVAIGGPAAARVILAALGCYALLLATAHRSAFARFLSRVEGPRPGALLLHGLVYIAFLATSRALSSGAPGGIAALAWIALAALTLATLALGGARAAAWAQLARETRGILGVGVLAGVLAWLGGLATDALVPTLLAGTLRGVAPILAPFYPTLSIDASAPAIATDAFRVVLAPECSGHEGIALVLVFLAIYLHLFRGTLRFPHALALVPIGIVAVWIVNVARIAALVAIGSSVSPAIAAGGFHSQAGWIGFLGVALGLVAASRSTRLFTRAGEPRGFRGVALGDVAAAPYLVPFIVLLSVTLVAGAASAGVDIAYPLKIVVAALVLVRYRAIYRTLLGSGFTWPAVFIGVAVGVAWVASDRGEPAQAQRLVDVVSALPVGLAFAWIAMRVAGSVIVVPLIEELAFRGYLLRVTIDRRFDLVPFATRSLGAIAVSSLAFGLMHGRWLAGTLAGVAFALAMWRRGRFGDALIAHAAANLVVALAVVVTGRWSLWT